MIRRRIRRLLVPLALLAATPALAQPTPTLAILGEPVVGRDGKPLGRLIDVMVDASGAPVEAAIDFGGFIGIGSRKIIVPWGALHFAPQTANKAIMLEMTQEQIKLAPDYKPAPPPTPPAQSP